MQIVAYNKMDVPESSDYWPEIQQSLEGLGVAPHSMCAISAVSGQGVLELIRMVHAALDELPTEVTYSKHILLKPAFNCFYLGPTSHPYTNT